MGEEVVSQNSAIGHRQTNRGNLAISKNRKDHEEIFTRLQLCKPCDAIHTPNISYFRCQQRFLVTELGLEASLRGFGQSLVGEKGRYSFISKNDPQGPLLHWRDICDLIKCKFIVRQATVMRGYFTVISLQEFRHHFEPLGRPKKSFKLQLRECFRIAWFWIPYCKGRPIVETKQASAIWSRAATTKLG